jgi:hypothetical protein
MAFPFCPADMNLLRQFYRRPAWWLDSPQTVVAHMHTEVVERFERHTTTKDRTVDTNPRFGTRFCLQQFAIKKQLLQALGSIYFQVTFWRCSIC